MTTSSARSCRLRGMLRRSVSDEGVVALEFALISPVFLLLIFATMAFALYFATFVAVIHGANEGARASVAGMSDTERASLANAKIQYIFTGYSPLLTPSHVVVQSSTPIAGMFQVTVSYPLTDFTFGAFYTLLASVAPSSSANTKPTTVSYSVTIADGGY